MRLVRAIFHSEVDTCFSLHFSLLFPQMKAWNSRTRGVLKGDVPSPTFIINSKAFLRSRSEESGRSFIFFSGPDITPRLFHLGALKGHQQIFAFTLVRPRLMTPLGLFETPESTGLSFQIKFSTLLNKPEQQKTLFLAFYGRQAKFFLVLFLLLSSRTKGVGPEH